MKLDKYIIYRLDIGMFCRWDEAVITFDTLEEVNEFIADFWFFFDEVENKDVIHVTNNMPGFDFTDALVINYKDITKEEKDEAKESFKAKMEKAEKED